MKYKMEFSMLNYIHTKKKIGNKVMAKFLLYKIRLWLRLDAKLFGLKQNLFFD